MQQAIRPAKLIFPFLTLKQCPNADSETQAAKALVVQLLVKIRPPYLGSEFYTLYCTFSLFNAQLKALVEMRVDEKIYLSSVLLKNPMKHNTVLIILTSFRY